MKRLIIAILVCFAATSIAEAGGYHHSRSSYTSHSRGGYRAYSRQSFHSSRSVSHWHSGHCQPNGWQMFARGFARGFNPPLVVERVVVQQVPVPVQVPVRVSVPVPSAPVPCEYHIGQYLGPNPEGKMDYDFDTPYGLEVEVENGVVSDFDD